MNALKLLWFVFALLIVSGEVRSQEVIFFDEGTDNNFYDQGIVDVNNFGESTFEHTYPPGGSPTQWNDKVPCSTNAFQGATSLKFNYTSSDNGNWKVSIYRTGWTTADISALDSISFFVFSEEVVPASALPLIAVEANKNDNSGDATTKFYSLSEYNYDISVSQWTQVKFPLSAIFEDVDNIALNFASTKGIIFNQSENNNSSRLLLIDEITAFKSIDEIPVVENLTAEGYDSHAELNWNHPHDGISYRIYASFDGGQNFHLRGETTDNFYLDFVPAEGRNKTVQYRVMSVYQNKESQPVEKTAEIRDFTDDELLDMMQRYTFRYFWEGAHQATGMSLERSNGNGRTAASGATGMGLMAMIAAHEREYRPQVEIKDRILSIMNFLKTCDRHHGAWSHWYNANTSETQPFSEKDDGGDIVETSYVAQALIALRNYFSGTDAKSVQIREQADQLWKEIDWDWYRQSGQNVLYWHWSPNYNFEMNMKVQGWNECLVTYLMAASSPTHSVPKEVYEQGWAKNGNMVNLRTYYNYQISLSKNWGGPLFFIHYSHLGINPHGLQDQYADYWQEHVNTALIHHAYAVENPKNHENYSDKCWGLTASDDPYGYTAHRPMDNDNGTISPTAALASMPYTPDESMKALKYFYRERGADLFGKYGPYDAFNDNLDWVKEAYLGIDQGPIIVMIENYRTGLLWNNVMKDADVQAGLNKLGFQYVTSSADLSTSEFKIYPNPTTGKIFIDLKEFRGEKETIVRIFAMDGRVLTTKIFNQSSNTTTLDCSELNNGLYLLGVEVDGKLSNRKLIIQR